MKLVRGEGLYVGTLSPTRVSAGDALDGLWLMALWTQHAFREGATDTRARFVQLTLTCLGSGRATDLLASRAKNMITKRAATQGLGFMSALPPNAPPLRAAL